MNYNIKEIDPYVVSVVEARLVGISQEIGQRVMKAAYSLPAATFRDLGAQIYDCKERLVALAAWLPIHTTGSQVALQGILDYVGRDNVHPGDFYMGNSPYIVRGGHLPDWSFVRPVFYKDEVVFHCYLRAHQYDSGGAHLGGYHVRPFDIHAEGVIIPPTKIFDQGKVNEDALRIIMANVRGSEKVQADVQLINGAMTLAEKMIVGLIDDYGINTVMAAIDKYLNLTEESVRKIFRTWPNGVYKSQAASDSDGTSPDAVWINLSLKIDADKGHLTFDYNDNVEQVDFINATYAIMYESTVTPLRWSLPRDITVNQGLFNCITLKTKPGTICHVTYPGSCGGQANAIASEVNECVQLALSQAIPKDVPAAWTRHQSPGIGGKNPFVVDPVTGKSAYYWTFGHFCGDGSSGAIWGYDGWDALLH
ncbi:hydantoinase B/oxoprolinase family protein, partial [Candidatus Omnitrophota bacterium]